MSLLARTTRVALGLTVAVAIASACGDEGTTTPGEIDAGTNDPTAARGRCPDAGPLEGTTCLLPEGTTCLYGACGAPIVRCSGGTWKYSTLEYRPPCPPVQPDLDQLCPVCWPSGATCSYDFCGVDAGEEGGRNIGLASCELDVDSGLVTWTVRVRPCFDAGADVQVDP